MIAGDVEQPDTGKLYVRTSSGFSFITDLSGARGIKGEAFTYADFTQEQIAELKRPAIEAAESANEAAQKANEKARIANEAAADASNVNAIIEGNTLTVIDRHGNSMSVNVKGAPGLPGVPGDDGLTPYIDPTTKHWMIGSTDTGIVAEGQDGNPGTPGSDGVSPVVSATPISGGVRVVITDKNGQHTFDVTNGSNGNPGDDGKSAYQSYLDTTTDNPKKTEAQWVASLKGEQGDPSTADINLNGTVVTVTNNAGQSSSCDLSAILGDVNSVLDNINGEVI